MTGQLEHKSLETPEETRTFPKGKLDVVVVKGMSVGRAEFEPGWKWSECLKSIAGTESCEAEHLCYVISGAMRIRMNDGSEFDLVPGEATAIPPGHDAWVVGDKKCVIVDFVGFKDYAVQH